MSIFEIKNNEKKDNSVIRMANVNGGQPFKISLKSLKKVHHTCDLEGKESDACRRELKSIGLEFIDD